MSRIRRRSRIAVVAAAIGLTVVAIAVWAVHPWVSHSLGSPSASAREADAARADLQRLVHGQMVVVVSLGAGFEAASYDQRGRLDFWVDASGSWVLQAARMYQSDSADSETPGSYTGQGVTVSGALLPGMSSATFVVHSLGFSGDGSATTDVYARGKSGWGFVAQRGASLVTTGRSATSPRDAFYGASLLPTGLRTSVLSSAFSNVTGSLIPLVNDWQWRNGRFGLAHSNTLTATIQPSPKSSARPLPWGVPGTGTYGGVLQGVSLGPAFPGTTQSVVVIYVLPALLTPGCLEANTCPVPRKTGYLPTLRFTLGGQTAFDYAVITSTGTSRISGPAWFLALADPYPQGNEQDPHDSPYSAQPGESKR